MKDGMMEMVAQLTKPPTCPKCGRAARYEVPEVSGMSYEGRVRAVCECGNAGKWYEYDFYAITFPDAQAILEDAERDFTKEGA